MNNKVKYSIALAFTALVGWGVYGSATTSSYRGPEVDYFNRKENCFPSAEIGAITNAGTLSVGFVTEQALDEYVRIDHETAGQPDGHATRTGALLLAVERHKAVPLKVGDRLHVSRGWPDKFPEVGGVYIVGVPYLTSNGIQNEDEYYIPGALLLERECWEKVHIN